ncbi:hypothetical protein KEM56_001758, partial [Ascosphaera pollenicola]
MAQSAEGSSSTPNNQAAWISTERGEFVVGDAPYPTPQATEVLLRNHAVAINNMDWKIQSSRDDYPLVPEYPFIIGYDCAGEVVEVGSNVKRFNQGDRVIG